MGTWVPVLVRLEDYDEIARWVAQNEASRVETSGDVGLAAAAHRVVDDGPRVPEREPWSVADLRRLATSDALTAQRWAKAMDVCVRALEGGTTWLSTSEVAERAGMDVKEWRDAPRKISRHLKANYPNVPKSQNGEHVWPLHGDGAAFKGGEVWWTINEEMATRWREARGGELP